LRALPVGARRDAYPGAGTTRGLTRADNNLKNYFFTKNNLLTPRERRKLAQAHEIGMIFTCFAGTEALHSFAEGVFWGAGDKKERFRRANGRRSWPGTAAARPSQASRATMAARPRPSPTS